MNMDDPFRLAYTRLLQAFHNILVRKLLEKRIIISKKQVSLVD